MWRMGVVALLLGGHANAQGWVQMPNGTLSYVTNYVTTGVFTCGTHRAFVGKCLASGNSVTVRNSTTSATFTYNGVNAVMVAPSTTARRFSLGSISTSVTGPPNGPIINSPARRIFNLSIAISPFNPTLQSVYFGMGFVSSGRNLQGVTNFSSLPILRLPKPPGHATYSIAPMGKLTYPTLDLNETDKLLSAQVSVAPEPVSMLLVATGLLGVGGMARRRRKRQVDRSAPVLAPPHTQQA
ncbi:MAG: PEP-CTERM sorting domain-containing protein [Gemmatimonadaceae bacterium]